MIREPFNLETYLANPERKVETRDKRPVRIICTDMASGTYPVVALVNTSGLEEVMLYNDNGEYYNSNNKQDLNLVFVPVRREGYAVLDMRKKGFTPTFYTQKIFTSEDDVIAYLRSLDDDEGIYYTGIEWYD